MNAGDTLLPMTKRRTIAAVLTATVAGFFVWRFPTPMMHLAVCILAGLVLVGVLALIAQQGPTKGGRR